MNRRVSIAVLVMLGSLALPASAAAAPSPGKRIASRGGNFGLGLTLGDPMGVSSKLFLAPNHALQFELGWAPMHHGDGRFGGDYLWHPGILAGGPVAELVPYLGFGIGIMFWGDGRCGRRYYDDEDGRYRRGHGYQHGRCGEPGGAAMFLRAPILGLAVHWKKAPVDVALEGSWSPYIVVPDLAHGDVSFKVRYYF